MCLAVVVLAAVLPAQAQVSVELEATANGQTQIDLSWDATVSQDWTVIVYAVEVSPTGTDGTWTLLAELLNDQNLPQPHPDDSYSHTGLTAGTTRHYRLAWIATRTTTDGGEFEGGDSNATSATTSSATSSATSD